MKGVWREQEVSCPGYIQNQPPDVALCRFFRHLFVPAAVLRLDRKSEPQFGHRPPRFNLQVDTRIQVSE